MDAPLSDGFHRQMSVKLSARKHLGTTGRGSGRSPERGPGLLRGTGPPAEVTAEEFPPSAGITLRAQSAQRGGGGFGGTGFRGRAAAHELYNTSLVPKRTESQSTSSLGCGGLEMSGTAGRLGQSRAWWQQFRGRGLSWQTRLWLDGAVPRREPAPSPDLNPIERLGTEMARVCFSHRNTLKSWRTQSKPLQVQKAGRVFPIAALISRSHHFSSG